MKTIYRIYYFFRFWRTDYYGNPINARFAWGLADVFADGAM